MSSRTCYDKYICFKLSLIILIIGLNSQLNRHVILNCTKGLYSIKTRRNALSNGCPASPSSQLWACAVSDASRSRQLWTGEHHHQAKAPGKSKIKRVLAYVRWQTSFTSLTPKSPIPQRHCGDYSKETGWHLLPAFGCEPYKWRRFGRRHTYCDVTTITQTRHLRFRRRQISRWRRRWSKINGVIGFFLLLFFPPRS